MSSSSPTADRGNPTKPLGDALARGRSRRRLSITLFSGVASGTTGFLAAITVSPLAAERLGGAAGWAGLPTAAGILGTALGAWAQGRAVAHRGRRWTLVAGYAIGALGAAGAAIAVRLDTLLLLVGAMIVMGFGNASNQLARYAHAEIQPPARRAFAISLIVWAGTIGAIVGPSLIDPASRVAAGWSQPELAGPYGVATLFLLLSFVLYLVWLHPDPSTLAHDLESDAVELETEVGESGAGATQSRAAPGSAAIEPLVLLAATAMVTAQTVMILIMTATPVHLGHVGAGLGIVGLVMSSHTFGMFALAPLFGTLADRWGRRRAIALGLSMLALSALLALLLRVLVPDAPPPLLAVPLFLLGLGWSCAFVSGSSLLAVGIPEGVRARLQGRIDATVLGAGATAGVASGLILQVAGYAALATLGLLLVAVSAAFLARQNARL